MTELLAVCLTLVSLGAMACVVLVSRRLPANDRQWLENMTLHYLTAYKRGQTDAIENSPDAPEWTAKITPQAPPVTGQEGLPPDQPMELGRN